MFASVRLHYHLILSTIIALAISAVLVRIDFLEWWYGLSRVHAGWQLDGLLCVLIGGLAGGLWFTSRRKSAPAAPAAPPLGESRALAESEARYRQFVEGSLRSVIIERGFELLYANPAAAELLGYDSAEELVALGDVTKLVTSRDVAKLKKGHWKPGRGRSRIPLRKLKCVRKNGAHVTMDGVSRPMVWEGEPAIMHSFYDSTEKRLAEESLRAGQRLLQTIVDNLPVGVFVYDRKRRFILANKALAEMSGNRPGDFQGKRVTDLGVGTKAELKRLEEGDRKVLDKGLRVEMPEETITFPDGRIEWRRVIKAPLYGDDGAIAGIVGVREDITERKQAEEELRLAKFSVDRAPDPIFWIQPDGKFAYVNEAACRVLGYSRKQLLRMTAPDIAPDFPAERWPEHWRELKRRGSFLMHASHRTKKGKVYPVEISVNYLKFGDKEYNCAIARDITERERAEQELRDSREALAQAHTRLSDAIESLPVSFALYDEQDRFVLCNSKTREMFPHHVPILVPGTPYADVVRLSIAKGLMKLDDQEAEAMVIERTAEHHTRQDVIELEFADGHSFEVYHRPTSDGGIVTIRMDISARKRAEQELRDSQRLLQTVFDTIPQQLSIKDLEGRYLKVNKAWCTTFGLSEPEVIHQLPSALSSRPAEETAEVMIEDHAVLKTGGGTTFYEDYRTVAGGEKRLFQFSKAPILDERGQIVGLTSMGLDITELKRTEHELRDSQRLLQTVFDTIPHILAIKDREGRYLKVNRAWCNAYDLTEEEVINKMPSALFSRPEKEVAEVEKEDMAAFEGRGEVHYFESLRTTTTSSERRLFQGIKAPILDEHDQIVGLATMGLDITDLKRAEQELRDNQRLLQTVFDVMPVGVFVKDRERKFIMVNEAFASIYGWKAEKLIGMESADLIQHDAEAFENSVKTDLLVLNEGERAEIDEEQATAMDGRRFWRRAIKVPLWDEEGKVTGIVGIREDISERKQVEQRELSRSEVLELLATDAPLSEVLERIVRVSEALHPEMLCSVLLLDEENECLRHGAAPSLPDYYNEAIDGVEVSYGSGSCGTAAKTGERVVVEDIMTHPFWVDFVKVATKAGLRACWSQPIISSGGEILGTFAMYYREAREPSAPELEQMKSAADLAGIAISRARTKDALRGSEERFRSLVDQAVDAFFILDLDGNIIDVNREASESLGYSPERLLSMRFEDFEQDPEFLAGLEKWKEGGDYSPMTLIGTHRRGDGTTFPVEVRLGAIDAGDSRLLLAVARNQSERRWMEEQVSQAQKMRAIGGLAGGIAHEFNNILTPLIGYTNLVQNRLQQDSEEFKDLAIVKKAANRARDLVAQILLFSRKKEGERKPLQLDLVAREVLVLLGSVLPKSIVIAQKIVPDLSLVFADATQMHILLMNLCSNANQAMPGGGVLQVNLENVKLDRFEITPNQHVSGDFVHLMVKDSGMGMDEDTVARVFEPFFTTKALGEGTGMGLSSVYGIVKNHDSHIMVSSKIGVGTIFHVYLPIIDTALAAPVERAEPASAGRESILFVDDEVDIMQMGKFGLEKLGYRVTAATNPLEALELFRENPKGFDLIATDQIMPEMNGDKLIAEIRRIRADIPVIVSTGYDDRLIDGKLDAQGVNKLVIKPFGYEEFGQIIREVLDTPAGPDLAQSPPAHRGETVAAHQELAEAKQALEAPPGGNVPVDLSGKRINTAGTKDNLIIEISGNQPLSEEEKQYLLSLYAQAKRDQKNTIVQCENGLYEFLRATGFDKFLELTVLQ